MKSTEVLPNDLMKVIGGIMSQVKTEVGNLGGFQLNVSNRPTFGVLNTTNRPMQEVKSILKYKSLNLLLF
jgi:hypothetical protein